MGPGHIVSREIGDRTGPDRESPLPLLGIPLSFCIAGRSQ